MTSTATTVRDLLGRLSDLDQRLAEARAGAVAASREASDREDEAEASAAKGDGAAMQAADEAASTARHRMIQARRAVSGLERERAGIVTEMPDTITTARAALRGDALAAVRAAEQRYQGHMRKAAQEARAAYAIANAGGLDGQAFALFQMRMPASFDIDDTVQIGQPGLPLPALPPAAEAFAVRAADVQAAQAVLRDAGGVL